MVGTMNRTVLVTGGSSGIGKAIAREFAKNKDNVIIISDIEVEKGLLTAEELRHQYEVSCDYFVCDISIPADVAATIGMIMDKYGRIDVLVNNAGIARDGLIDKISDDNWHKVLDVNLSGAFYCTKAVIGGMKENHYGKIINISSVSAEMGNFGQANYAASKGGLISMTKTVARESAKYQINVNAIAPGFIRTRMVEVVPEKVLEKIMSQIPMARLGEVEEVAKVAFFLASDDSKYITGQVINVNGGFYM